MSERIVALGATEYFLFTTRDYDTGAPQTLGGTPALSVYEDNGTTEITSGVSVSADFDSRTGLNLATVVATTGNGFEAGKRYNIVVTTGSVDSVSVVGEVIATFRIETVAEKARRELNEYLYPQNEISTVTSNSTTAVNLTDIVDAQTDDDSLIGQLLCIRDATDGALIWAVITDLASLVATVELYPNGGAMPITVAAGDRVWLMGPVYGHKLGTGAQADVRTAAGLASANLDTQLAALPTAAENRAEMDSNSTQLAAIVEDTGTTLPATLATIAGYLDTEIAAILADTNEMQGDLADGGRIDLLIDAIKAVTDALTAAGAAKLALSTAGIITGVAQTGTLSATQASTDLTGFADDELIGRVVVFTGGTAAGQASEITDYANTNGVLTFNAISTAPTNNDPFIIV